MKKLLTTFVSIMLFLSLTINAQTESPSSNWAISAQGGYSWINGVVGGDLQIGNFGFALGWYPARMPLSGEQVNSIGYNFTYYTDMYDRTSYYVSIGQASAGYRYENSWGSENIIPMTICMVGMKSGSDNFYWKIGAGYGWCDLAQSWTGEITVGIPLFTNYEF